MNNRGFTIIESLVSIILLSITLAGGIQLYFMADQLAGLTFHKKFATNVINSEMEILRNTPYANIVNNTTSIMVGGLSAQTNTSVVDVDAAGAPNPPFAFKKVDIQVLWNEPGEGAARSYTITTYIAP